MPTLVGSNFANVNPVSVDLAIACPLPVGLQDGDRLLGFCLYGDAPANELLAPPAEWTAFDASNANSSAQVSVVWTTYQAAVTPALTWTLTDVDAEASGLNKAVAGVLAYRNTPAPVFGTPAEGTGTSATASGITTTRDNSIVVFLSSAKVSSIGAITGPAGFTQRVAQTIGGGGGTAIWMGDQTYPTGSTATGSKVATNTLAGALWYALLVEFPAWPSVPNAPVVRWTGSAFVEQEMAFG